MNGADIAVACCRRSGDASPDDLYPDPDAGPLQAALAALGASAKLVSWDDPTVDWASFSRILVSSTWDSVDRPVEYLDWARRASVVSDLVNPVRVIEWNLDKIHHQDLAAAGVPTIPTRWVRPDDVWSSPPGAEFVVKPSVSAGGRNTARYAAGDAGALSHVRALQLAGQTVMVQEYLSAIDSEGETDLIFLDGTFSHAVTKQAALRTGQGIVDRPWERMAWSGTTEPDCEQLAVARRAMAAVSERFGDCPLYGRVDLVRASSGSSMVLEVELIDPYLSLDVHPEAAARLARSLCRP